MTNSSENSEIASVRRIGLASGGDPWACQWSAGAAGSGTERDRLGTELVPDGQQAVGDFVQRLVPRYALPVAFAARTVPAQGVL